MANTAANVLVGVTGAVYHGATAATGVPTSATGTIGTLIKPVGYISDAGVTQSISTSTTKIKAWQNSDVVRTIQTEHDVTYKFKMLEHNAETALMFYGNGTAASATLTGATLGHELYIFDINDGSATMRLVVPDGQITERGDVTFVNSETVAYEVTVTAYPDTSGNKAYIYKS